MLRWSEEGVIKMDFKKVFKKTFSAALKLSLLTSFLPAQSITYKQPPKPRTQRASIAAMVKNKKLTAYVPSADTDGFDYHWKLFQDGMQVGDTLDGADLSTDLLEGDYNVHLTVERKTDHKIVSTASVSVHARS